MCCDSLRISPHCRHISEEDGDEVDGYEGEEEIDVDVAPVDKGKGRDMGNAMEIDDAVTPMKATTPTIVVNPPTPQQK